jgi:hypothetical protein
MKQIILTIALSVIAVISGYSQNTLSGVIVDEKSKSPLVGVTIVDSNSGKGTISEDSGEFTIVIDEYPIVFIFRHLGYFEDSLRIETDEQFQRYYEDKTLSISMRVNPFKLDEIVVSTPGIAVKLFGNEPYSIMDYVVKDDRFIALGYKNHNTLKREIFLGKLSGEIILSTPLRSFEEIYQDCQGEVYAVTSDRAFLTKIKDDSIYLNPICDAKFFEENVKPVQALDNQNFLFVDKSPEGQYHDYYVCDSETNKQELFYRVGDEKRERAVINIDNQVRGEFVGKIKQGFISSAQMRIINARIAKLQNQINTDYRPIQSSMFQLEDSVLLFDFDYQAVHCYTINANLLWRTDIQVELNKDFTGRVHHDKISNRFFLEFVNIQLSYLIEIDPLTGEEIQTIPINKFKHIDHISIYDNRIFFLHQPDFGDRGKKIYFLDI